MKKRFFFAMALAAVAMVGNAQDAYIGNKFFDIGTWVSKVEALPQ